MDSTPADYGSPVYLTGSHQNTAVPDNDVFVDIEMSGLEEWKGEKLQGAKRRVDSTSSSCSSLRSS